MTNTLMLCSTHTLMIYRFIKASYILYNIILNYLARGIPLSTLKNVVF